MMTEQMTQGLALVTYTAPANVAASGTSAKSGVIDMSKYKRALFVTQVGVIDAAGTLDANLQSSANSNFNVAHNITGTNLTQVPNTGSNTVVTIEVRADQVAQQNAGDRYVRQATTVTTNAIIYGILGFGGEAIQHPISNNTTVITQQIVCNS